MKKQYDRAFWFANGIAIAIALVLFADAFGVLPRIGGGISSQAGNGYGLIYVDKKASSPGFTLVAPLRGNTAYLLDWRGKLFHSWRIPGLPSLEDMAQKSDLATLGILQARLLKNGNILAGHGGQFSARPDRGTMPVLLELDWGGNVVWRYENEMMHHDFARLPDGRTAVIVWEKLSEDLTKRVKGGIPGSEKGIGMFSDAILEIDEKGNVVWRWALWERLDPGAPENVLPSKNPRNIWTALNSIEYLENNPITQKPAYLIGVHRFGAVLLVERESGKIVWRGGGREVLASPHSAVLTAAGNILVFDNGADPPPGITGIYIPRSKILELSPAVVDGTNWVGAATFQYVPEPPVAVKAAFFTPANGSVEELSNGNILVSAGVTGRVFEIERSTKRVVWDYVSPFGYSIAGWPSFIMNAVYAAHRYPVGYAPQLK